jgi:alcohol dehydrogenase class IV
MRFEFATATRIVFGPGALGNAGALIKELGRRALVVTGRTSGRAQPLLANLSGQGVHTSVFPVVGEPGIADVERGTSQARQGRCDVVVGIGGGGALDAAKAIAALLGNEGEVLDYLEVIGRGKALDHPSAPFVAIPTTAGTGSEVTRNAVLASPEHRVKVSMRSPHLLARLAVVDPELMLGLPPAITASTGLDALTQLIEPCVCTRANPMIDALCLEGIRRVGRSLRVAFQNGGDLRAREDMAVAALFGGFALANAGLGAVHGLAGPIGGMFPAPHGAVCAALLAPVIEMNCRALAQREPKAPALRRYGEIAALVTGNPEATANDLVEWTRKLVADLKVPRLRAYAMTAAPSDELIEKAGRASSMKTNPIALSQDELREIIGRAW